MIFREYSTSTSTLKEWSRQLRVANRGNYPIYETDFNTLNHWKDTLNKNIGSRLFKLSGTPEATISDWKDKLNGIYN